MSQAHYICYALYFYYYYISSTSDHQALDLRVWGIPALCDSGFDQGGRASVDMDQFRVFWRMSQQNYR